MKKGGRMKRWGMNWLAVALLAAAVSGCQSAGETMALSGKALYDEKCRTVAGEKIYRTVPGVEGVLLMKVRPRASDREWSDQNWPGAAFAGEAFVDSYLMTFLGFEHGVTRGEGFKSEASRGYINPTYLPDDSNLPGYRYVDVIDAADGKRYRYTGSVKVVGRKDTSAPSVQQELRANPNYDLNVYRWTLDKKLAPEPAPRYGVTFEDHVVPDERALWVASSTVKVVDLQTQDVLGEMTRYAWASPPNAANPSPWLRAWRCPTHGSGSDAMTRKFVDQILIPKKGN